MTYSYVNFRQNAAGPSGLSDAPGDTYCTGTVYPVSGTLLAGVYPIGFGADLSSISANIDNTLGAHFAGYVPCRNNGDNWDFRIGGLTAGQKYRIRAALGDRTATWTNGFKVRDSNHVTVLASVANTSVPAGSFMDPTGVVHASAALWTANNAYIEVIPTGADLYLGRLDGSGYTYYATLGIEAQVAGGSISDMCTLGV
jgi:hypothetical protein